MAYILRAFIVDAGDRTIKVGHEFYGLTEREVETYMREHLGSCEYFKAAEKDGRVLTEIEKVDRDELPDPEDFEEEDAEEEEEEEDFYEAG